MTEVDFYAYVDDRARMACVLAAKALEQGLRVLIHTADAAATEHMDRLLWTYQPHSFVPHCRGGHHLAAVTPVLVDHAPQDIDRDGALINLRDETPPFFSRFHRLVEIVGLEEEEQRAARERYRFYRDRGYVIRSHDLSGKGGK
jgi:DNA polymerase-3 subunit chi